MTICERRALQRKWEAGEPGVRYRMSVALARERVARALRRKIGWFVGHPESAIRCLAETFAGYVETVVYGLAKIADAPRTVVAKILEMIPHDAG